MALKALLSPRDLAQAIGASESSLKRWADDGRIQVTRTAGGHRRIAVQEAIRFIRDNQAPLVNPEVLGLSGAPALVTSKPGPELYDLLVEGRSRDAGNLLLGQYMGGARVEELCDGVIREAMARVGELWQNDFNSGVLTEHRATDACLGALSTLRFAVEPAESSRVAVGAAPGGDPHLIPTMMAATVVASVGFRSINLGPDTPGEVLLEATTRYDANLVWISVSDLEVKGWPDDALTVERDLRTRGVPMMIGGRTLGSLQREEPHAVIGGSMAELAAFARGLTSRAGDGTVSA